MQIHRSRLFAEHPCVVFGMSTRNGGVSPHPWDLNLSLSVGDAPENVATNRERFFSALGIGVSQIAFPLQVHSADVRYAAKAGRYPATDGLMTDRADLHLAVTVADCLPVFLYDPGHGAIAGIHAGWKGSSQHITKRAVESMSERWNTDPADIVAYLGPSAGRCCYEVGEEVARLFPGECIEPNEAGKYLLDIPAYNTMLLIEAGVPPERIEREDRCTICTSELYHSYRRDGGRSGRMMGIIGMRENR
jgi:polyphenol oxidase